MSDVNDENLKLYFLQEYYAHGMFARVGVAKFFLEQLQKNFSTYIPNKPERVVKFDLNNKQKLGLLQIGTISHLMLLIEDMATIFTAFKSKDWNYYQYLDRKGEDDLGTLIGRFYSEINTLTDEDIRLILGYIDPRDLPNSESEKDFLRSIIKKNIFAMKYFLTKSSVFWSSHIAVFRRYKHAGFPIVLGLPIPQNDAILKKEFDFVSFALTAKEKLVEEVTVIPFSKRTMESYGKFLEEMSVMLFSSLENNLIRIERDLKGAIPNPDELLSKRLTKNERKKLRKIRNTFMESNKPQQLQFHAQATPRGMYPPWYVHLDTYCKSSIDILIEKEFKHN